MFGVEKSKIGVALFFIALICMPIVLAQATTQEVYDINDRQTKDLKSYIDGKLQVTKDEVNKLTDSLFQTWDKRMQDLTKNFAIQATIMMFFAILLANMLTILLRQGHEKKLIEYRYNNLLNKEVEINRKLEELNIILMEERFRANPSRSKPSFTTPQENNQTGPDPSPKAASKPVGRPKKAAPETLNPTPAPVPMPPLPPPIKPERKGILAKILGSGKPKPSPEQIAEEKHQKDLDKALKGVR
jgi:hypothetical protein